MALVQTLLLRYLSEKLQPIPNIKTLSDLPKCVYEELMQLAKLAAEGIKDHRYVFSEIPVNTMGLMHKEEGLQTARRCFTVLQLPSSYTARVSCSTLLRSAITTGTSRIDEEARLVSHKGAGSGRNLPQRGNHHLPLASADVYCWAHSTQGNTK